MTHATQEDANAPGTAYLCIVGTRPEAIKMAPVILALSRIVPTVTLLSGQHPTMAGEALAWFGIDADLTIDLGERGNTLSELTTVLLPELDRALQRLRPAMVMGQGDTTTVMVAALAAFYLKIPFAHVEAGLRTGDLEAPFPEELNRIVADRIAAYHFCPTQASVDNLLGEGIDNDRIFLTGNTVIDALRFTLERGAFEPAKADRRRILLTMHRRENHGAGIDSVCRAARRLVATFDDVEIVVSVHPNPDVRQRVLDQLADTPRIELRDALSYRDLVSEMLASTLILTDSGGIQEEAPFLKKPVLVLRDKTERPEAVDMGVARLIGTAEDAIVTATGELLTDDAAYARMAGGGSPYGDGFAAQRIVSALGLAAEPPRP